MLVEKGLDCPDLGMELMHLLARSCGLFPATRLCPGGTGLGGS